MEPQKSKWQGKRGILVVRQSNDDMGTASNQAQLDHLKKKFKKLGIQQVDVIRLDGVAASAPARVAETINALFKRKAEKNDFDTVAWLVEDRASRSGGEHGLWFEHEAKRRGINILFADDDLPNVPYAPVIRVAKYEAAKEVSVSNGRRSTQGQTWAQKKGFFRTAGPTPMGCDRLYLDEGNKKKFILRNLPSGLQEQLDYETRKVIGNFGTVGKKSQNRFIKQRNEYSLLIPGERQYRRVVRVIYYLRYKRGWRGWRIADYLNRNGIPSPTGKQWSPRQVQIVYENSAYTGVTYNDKTFSGRFFRRDRVMGYVALDRDECEMILKKAFVPEFRPMDEWERIDQPYMYDFLPRDVRDLAIPSQATVWQERADPTRPKRKVNAHPASDYLLSDRLRAIQDGKTLKGTLSGPPDHKVPYYRHPSSRKGLRKGSVLGQMIPMMSLHEAIVKLLADVLRDAPDLRARLTEHLNQIRQSALHDEPDVKQLEAERDELKQQINTALRFLKGAALADAEQELERLGDRRNAIEARLAAISTKHSEDTRPAEQVVEEALKLLADDSQQLLTLPTQPLRDLVDIFVVDPTVDMETKAVEFKIALPTWAMMAAKAKLKNQKKQKNAERAQFGATEPLCPSPHSWSQSDRWTQIIMATARCEYRWVRGSHTHPPCYECRRLAA